LILAKSRFDPPQFAMLKPKESEFHPKTNNLDLI